MSTPLTVLLPLERPSPAVSWDGLRIPGVLQRLAFSYLLVATLDLLVARVHVDNLAAVSANLLMPHCLP